MYDTHAKNRIVFIYQNAFSQTGGIQTFNKYFISALEEISEEQGLNAELVGIYDDEKDVKSSLPFTGLQNSKMSAFWYIISHARKFDTFIFAHVNLAPLAIFLHLLNPKARIIFCTHGIEIWKKLPRTTEWIMNRSTILTVSNFSMNELKRHNPHLKDVHLFPNCIKVRTDSVMLENPYNPDEFNLLSVTRLSSSEKLKGIDSVIKALPHLVAKISNIKYSVIGKGEDVERLQSLASDLGVAQYVDFLGFVEDIDSYYLHCDLFILPSKKEGFGIVYLEAMQYKKPVIAVNYGGPTDVVIEEVTGYLCEYGDIKCLENRISILYNDQESRKHLGNNGYNHLIENFTFCKFKDRLETILQKKKAS